MGEENSSEPELKNAGGGGGGGGWVPGSAGDVGNPYHVVPTATIEDDDFEFFDADVDSFTDLDAGQESTLLASLGVGLGVGALQPSLVRVVSTDSASTLSRLSDHKGRMRADSVLSRKQRKRAVMKNGDYNIVQINVSERRRRYLLDLFTTLVDAQWRWTLFVFTMSFVLSWSGFGTLWWLIAFTHGDFEPENLGNETWVPCVSNIHSLTSAFLFSIETQHTIGYGSRYPTEDCPEAVIMVVIQSITGMMIQTLMVGIIFAKMARPKQRTETLLFSRTAVICQRDGQLCLMFRAGDMRDKSHLIATSIRALLVRPRITQEGEILAPFLSELKLSVDQYDPNVFLLWPAVVIHRIDRESPLYTMSAAELLTDKFEIIVTLEGTIESTGQPTQARTSYLPSELLWGHRFEPMIHYSKERLAYEVDYALFHNTYQVDTPLCCAQVLDSLTLDSSTTKPVIY